MMEQELALDLHGSQAEGFRRTDRGRTEDFGGTVQMAMLGILNPDQIAQLVLHNVTNFIWDRKEQQDCSHPS